MQTFLPYPDFLYSARVLDKKRCWKQVVEAKQIISILSHLEECPKDKVPWEKHPAVKMWEGHIECLKLYYNFFLFVSKDVHKVNTTLPLFQEVDDKYRNWEGIYKPWWLGNKDFHRAMRSRLIEKNREFYLPLFPDDEGFNDGLYLWPDMETRTFKTIKPKK